MYLRLKEIFSVQQKIVYFLWRVSCTRKVGKNWCVSI